MADPLLDEDDKEKQQEKEEPADPVNDEKDVKLVPKGDNKLTIKYKYCKRCKLLKNMCQDTTFGEDLPLPNHEEWAVKKMNEFLEHYNDKIKPPPVKHPVRRKELAQMKPLLAFLKPEEEKKPDEWKQGLLNLISYCTTETKENEGEAILDDWLARYLNDFTMPHHAALINLANFVDCKVLLDFLCASFALKYLVGKNSVEMRKELNVEDDFSEEEKKQLQYHFVWDKLIDWKDMKVPTAAKEEKKE